MQIELFPVGDGPLVPLIAQRRGDSAQLQLLKLIYAHQQAAALDEEAQETLKSEINARAAELGLQTKRTINQLPTLFAKLLQSRKLVQELALSVTADELEMFQRGQLDQNAFEQFVTRNCTLAQAPNVKFVPLTLHDIAVLVSAFRTLYACPGASQPHFDHFSRLKFGFAVASETAPDCFQHDFKHPLFLLPSRGTVVSNQFKPYPMEQKQLSELKAVAVFFSSCHAHGIVESSLKQIKKLRKSLNDAQLLKACDKFLGRPCTQEFEEFVEQLAAFVYDCNRKPLLQISLTTFSDSNETDTASTEQLSNQLFFKYFHKCSALEESGLKYDIRFKVLQQNTTPYVDLLQLSLPTNLVFQIQADDDLDQQFLKLLLNFAQSGFTHSCYLKAFLQEQLQFKLTHLPQKMLRRLNLMIRQDQAPLRLYVCDVIQRLARLGKPCLSIQLNSKLAVENSMSTREDLMQLAAAVCNGNDFGQHQLQVKPAALLALLGLAQHPELFDSFHFQLHCAVAAHTQETDYCLMFSQIEEVSFEEREASAFHETIVQKYKNMLNRSRWLAQLEARLADAHRTHTQTPPESVPLPLAATIQKSPQVIRRTAWDGPQLLSPSAETGRPDSSPTPETQKSGTQFDLKTQRAEKAKAVANPILEKRLRELQRQKETMAATPLVFSSPTQASLPNPTQDRAGLPSALVESLLRSAQRNVVEEIKQYKNQKNQEPELPNVATLQAEFLLELEAEVVRRVSLEEVERELRQCDNSPVERISTQLAARHTQRDVSPIEPRSDLALSKGQTGASLYSEHATPRRLLTTTQLQMSPGVKPQFYQQQLRSQQVAEAVSESQTGRLQAAAIAEALRVQTVLFTSIKQFYDRATRSLGQWRRHLNELRQAGSAVLANPALSNSQKGAAQALLGAIQEIQTQEQCQAFILQIRNQYNLEKYVEQSDNELVQRLLDARQALKEQLQQKEQQLQAKKGKALKILSVYCMDNAALAKLNAVDRVKVQQYRKHLAKLRAVLDQISNSRRSFTSIRMTASGRIMTVGE